MTQTTYNDTTACEGRPQSLPGRRFRRNLFTGQLEEVYDDPRGEFDRLNQLSREKVAWMVKERYGNPWDTGTDHVCRPMSIPPEQATPDRIERENAAAKHHGTGAWYDKQGNCHTPSRGSRAREMRRGHTNGISYQDNDAGYSDCAGR